MKEKYSEVQNPPPNVEKPPCRAGKTCPGDRNYLLKQEHLGDKCTACGSLIRNLEYCPVIQRQKAAESNAGIFTTGGQIKALVEKVPAEVPRVAENAPMELTIKFSGKQWAVLKQIVREGQADTLEEAVLFLVDEAGERMEGS
jgi:hypothetical protein